MNHFLLLTVLLLTTQSIRIPLKPNRPRCLVQYLIGTTISTIKLKMIFPKLNNVQPGEHFTITIRNTETQQIITEILQPGEKFTKQEPLDQNVIYQVCVTLKSQRDFQHNQQPLVQYYSQSIYNHDHAEITVPPSLLTKDDMKSAYISAAYLANKINEYQQEQRERQKVENHAFLQTERLNYKLTTLSIVEITVVILAGLYQFFTLKNYLSSKQYM